jgi:hypothetical protein
VSSRGELVAHADGTARILSQSGEGSVLVVQVETRGRGRPSGAETEASSGRRSLPLEIRPAGARMRSGAVQAFQALSIEGGAPAEWRTSDERVLRAVGGGLFQAKAPGTARVCAEAEGRNTCVDVEVTP